MKKVTSNELRTINGGARYTCTTRVWKTNLYTMAGQRYQSWAKCGFVTCSKWLMGYHFLFAHGGGGGCTYTVR